MRRFVFRLSRVLEIRGMQVDTERRKLDQLVGQREAIAARITAAEQEQDATFTVPIPQLHAAGNYRQYLGRVTDKLRQDLAAAADCAEAQRRIVIEAERRCQLLERLKSRRRADWEGELARELDELAADAHRARLHAARTSAEKR